MPTNCFNVRYIRMVYKCKHISLMNIRSVYICEHIFTLLGKIMYICERILNGCNAVDLRNVFGYNVAYL